MLLSRAQKAMAVVAVSASLVLGATGAAQAGPSVSTDRAATSSSEVQARTAAKPSSGSKLRYEKKLTVKLALKKKSKYGDVQRYLTRNAAAIPASVSAAASAQVKAGNKRINKMVVKVTKAKTVKKVKKLRGKIRAQRPSDVQALVIIAQRAVASANDQGALEGLLDDLLGLNLDESLLGPIIDLVDSLLGSVGTGGPTGLLDGLLDLLNDLLGGLLGGLGR